jgi:repressor LexA
LTVNVRSPYNNKKFSCLQGELPEKDHMSRELSPEMLQKRADTITSFSRTAGRMPTFSEIGALLGLRSKNAVAKLVRRLEAHGMLRRDAHGRLVLDRPARSLRLLGSVEAGFPSPAEEELADTLSLDDLLIKNPQASFLLKVSGDSMSGAGILPGDLVIVDRAQNAKNGDIVIAEIDGAWTMKYLKKEGDSVLLVAANARYRPIQPRQELKIAGVITGVVRKYQ